MKKKTTIIVISLVLIGLIGFAGYNYVMYGGARDLASEEASFTLSSKDITNEFTQNIDESNKKYLEKAVALTGTITEINGTQMIVDNSIICNMKAVDNSVLKGQKITVKGRVVGYDDLMQELKLDQCLVIIK